MLFHFLSYKFGRLLLPYALISAAAATFWLPEPYRTPIAALEVMFYGAGAVDPMIPERWLVKRISSAIRTFLVLMAADLCAIVIFFVPAEKLWKPTQIRSTPRVTAAR
jgi:hypothetical protein